MNRALVTLALAVLIAGAAASAAEAKGGAPAGKRFDVRIGAPSLGDSSRSVRVYLPASYDAPEARDRRYPIVVFLHGWPGGNGNWPGEGHADDTLDSLIAAKRIPEVIALFPDGNGLGLIGRSIWLNTWDGRSRMEDFLCHDLLGWADHTYRTRPGAKYRAAIGLSDGATAAMNLIFKHPDLYAAAGAHSGNYRLAKDFTSHRLFGPDSAAARVARDNSPLAYVDAVAKRIAGQAIYFDCGTGDVESIASNRELDAKLTALGVPHVFHAYPGDHGWGYWRQHLHESLLAVTAGMW